MERPRTKVARSGAGTNQWFVPARFRRRWSKPVFGPCGTRAAFPATRLPFFKGYKHEGVARILARDLGRGADPGGGDGGLWGGYEDRGAARRRLRRPARGGGRRAVRGRGAGCGSGALPERPGTGRGHAGREPGRSFRRHHQRAHSARGRGGSGHRRHHHPLVARAAQFRSGRVAPVQGAKPGGPEGRGHRRGRRDHYRLSVG